MINVSSDINVEKDKGVLVLVHILDESNNVLINSYGFKSEDIIKNVSIVNEQLYINNDKYENVNVHIKTTLGVKYPPLNEMLDNNLLALHDLVDCLREEIEKNKQTI